MSTQLSLRSVYWAKRMKNRIIYWQQNSITKLEIYFYGLTCVTTNKSRFLAINSIELLEFSFYIKFNAIIFFSSFLLFFSKYLLKIHENSVSNNSEERERERERDEIDSEFLSNN